MPWKKLSEKALELDAFLLDRVAQPLSDWWKDLTGLSNFWCAKWFFRLAFAALLCNIFQQLLGLWAMRNQGAITCLGLVLLVSAVYGPSVFQAIAWLDKYGQLAEEELEITRAANPLRPQLTEVRLTNVFASCSWPLLIWIFPAIGHRDGVADLPISPIVWIAIFYAVLTPALYFFCCTPRPRTPRFRPVQAEA